MTSMSASSMTEKMTAEECKQEEKQLEEIKGITVQRVGFVSIEGS